MKKQQLQEVASTLGATIMYYETYWYTQCSSITEVEWNNHLENNLFQDTRIDADKVFVLVKNDDYCEVTPGMCAESFYKWNWKSGFQNFYNRMLQTA